MRVGVAVLVEPACDARVAGLPSIERLLLSAEAAGMGPFVVVSGRPEVAEHCRRLQAECRVVAAGSPEASETLQALAAGHERCLVIHCGLALDAGYLSEMAQVPAAADAIVLGVASGPAPEHAFYGELPPNGGRTTHSLGVALVPARDVPRFAGPAAEAGPAWARLTAEARRSGRLVPFTPARPHLACLLGGEADRARATRELVRLAGKETDGLVSRHLNRRFSALVTLALLRTPVTPNAVTFATLALGLFTGVVLSLGSDLALLFGALLYQTSSALDGCDGEIARLRFRCSRFGEWADSLSDHVTNVAFTAGLAAGLFRRSGGEPIWLGLGAFTVAVYLLTAGAAFARMRRLRDGAHLSDFGSSIRRRLPAGSSHARVFYVFETMVRRDFYALFFFLLALLRLSPAIPFLLALGAAGHLPALLVRPRAAA